MFSPKVPRFAISGAGALAFLELLLEMLPSAELPFCFLQRIEDNLVCKRDYVKAGIGSVLRVRCCGGGGLDR